MPNIREAKLGIAVQKKLSIYFSDIRSFTTISELMSPEENFEFINEYLKVCGPEIRNKGGFIDKYIGDAIMALFPKSPDDALKAAIVLQKTLLNFNRKRPSIPPIKVGIGINTGEVMLGTVGEENRNQWLYLSF